MVVEMHAPERITPRGLADYLEVLTKVVFQSGISWRVVEAKWPDIKAALHDFDPATLADLTPDELDALSQDKRVIRNRRKLQAISDNAGQMLDLAAAHGSFQHYLRSHAGFDETVADLRKKFRFVGEHGAYYFLHVVGENVPDHETWCAAHS
jgi:3-methyladenine DNA glycosylase Tag